MRKIAQIFVAFSEKLNFTVFLYGLEFDHGPNDPLPYITWEIAPSPDHM